MIDSIVPEPLGGAHRNRKMAIDGVRKSIQSMLNGLEGQSREKLIKARRDKFLNMGSKGLAA